MANRLTPLLLAGVLSAASCAPGPAARTTPDPRAVVEHFLDALGRADLDAVMSVFAGDATVFFPTARNRERIGGRAEIERRFAVYLDEIRAERSAPPYVTIVPRDLAVQEFGDAAIVTFHSGRADGNLARRTFVLRREAAGWRIVHLHASNLAAEP